MLRDFNRRFVPHDLLLLTRADGRKQLDITDFSGKVFYLYCFQPWCPGCHRRGFPGHPPRKPKRQEE